MGRLVRRYIRAFKATVVNTLIAAGKDITNAVVHASSGKKIAGARVAGPASYTTGGFTYATGLTTIEAVNVTLEGAAADDFLPQIASISGGDVVILVRRNIEQFVDESGTGSYTIGDQVAAGADISALYFHVIAIGT